MPETPRSGSPAVSNGTNSWWPRPPASRASNAATPDWPPIHTRLPYTEMASTRPTSSPCSAANTRTESPTTSTSSPLWYPSHVRPLLSVVMTLARLRSSPCRATNCSQPRPGRRRKTPTLNAIATHSPPSRSRATAWISRPLGRCSRRHRRQGHGSERVTFPLPESDTADPEAAAEIAVDARQHRRGVEPRDDAVTDAEQSRRRTASRGNPHRPVGVRRDGRPLPGTPAVRSG